MASVKRTIPTPTSGRRKSTAPISTSRDADTVDSPSDSVFKVPLMRRSQATTEIARAKTPTSRPTAPALSKEPQLNDAVSALSFTGVLRYWGPIQGREGVFGGIELTGSHAGKGKNDGSVGGVSYFLCAPNDGIFVPANKISSMAGWPPGAPSTTPQRLNNRSKTSSDAARAAEAKITSGSRASRYLNMTAEQLASLSSASPTRPTTSQADLLGKSTFRQADSPDKMNSSQNTTPRPKGRPSLGLTPRKSFGAASGQAPRSLKRPSSRLSNAGLPDVPPLPSTYRTPSQRSVTPSQRSVTPSQRSVTPSQRSVTPSRKAFDSERPSRPTTPARSVSRQSQVSESSHRRVTSIARPLSRASAYEATPSRIEFRSVSRQSHVDHDVESLEAEKLSAVRAAEEARLAQMESERSLKQSQARFEEMRLRWEEAESQVKALTAQSKLSASTSQNHADSDRESKSRIEELERELEKANSQCSELFNRIETELEVERQAKDRALSQLRQDTESQLAESKKESEEMQAQLDQLREAGQALCGVYEERLAEVDAERLKAVLSLEQAQQDLEAAKAKAELASQPNGATVPQTPTALSIDNENLRLDLDHTKGRLHELEEQLAESQQTLENELDNMKKRKADWVEVEHSLRSEIQALQQVIDRNAQAEQSSNAKLSELEGALRESKQTLESERSEIERLRGGNQDSSQLEAKLAALRKQADDLNEEVQLLEEIKTEHMELQTETATTSKATEAELAQLRAELAKKDAQIASLKRESNNLYITSSPVIGSRRISSGSVTMSEDEQKSLLDQIVGLKVIVNQLTDENQEYSEQNKQLLLEASTLKEAQRTLERTVENLMAQMEMEQAQEDDQQESPSLRRSVRGSKPPLPPNMEGVEKELRKQIADVERRKNREIAQLNQELSELEHLVEAKIFREDELESNIKKYRRLLDKAREQGFNTNGHDGKLSKASIDSLELDEGACELCGDKGHDLEHCPVMNGEPGADGSDQQGKQYCEDCEAYGHSTSNCPLSQEVF